MITSNPAFKMETRDLHFFYGPTHALKNINIHVRQRQITALIGPSGCGKSTFLRALNRLNERIPHTRTEGAVLLDGQDIYKPGADVVSLRQRVGMVFQLPNPFPKSIFENIAFGPRVLGVLSRGEIAGRVEQSLKSAALWPEVSNRLHTDALNLNLGQQQRLCIPRVLAVQPEGILMDEPWSALDPIATLKIEELMQELKKNYTIIIVTHNMQQAARVLDYTAMMILSDAQRAGTVIEYNETNIIFTRPQDKRTEDYVTGRFG